EDVEVYQDFRVELNADFRYFFNEGLFDGQERTYLSFAIKPEYVREWEDGKYTLKFVGFARFDQHDRRRTHFDIRELYWQVVQDNAELSIGVKKIFWGVTESAHLVDIINQTDIVESFDGEEKLGQPMVHYSYLTGFGTLDVFVLPYFRRPDFPGRKGRLRTPIVLDSREFDFESSAGEYRPDLAARYSNYFGIFDVGVSYFYGTGREPIVTSLEEFRPIYGIIHQFGLDLQATTGPVLWKFETIRRLNNLQDVFALVGGIEYTFGNIGGSGIDWGILGEYLYDDRGNLALNSLQNDLFFGSRIGFNDTQDTQILFGGIVDLDRSTRIFSIEADRRLGESWTTEVEARIFANVAEEEFLYFFREDSFLRFSLSKYF
ncbi:MAG: hypothetical protein AAGA85_05355, partial [Bacteroidota bacterium]